jgi:Na+/glutamate symporter
MTHAEFYAESGIGMALAAGYEMMYNTAPSATMMALGIVGLIVGGVCGCIMAAKLIRRYRKQRKRKQLFLLACDRLAIQLNNKTEF